MTQLSKVNCRYGAPLGRCKRHSKEVFETGFDHTPFKFFMFKVRLDTGGYDDGGAYWGVRVSPFSLYCVRDDEGEIEFFIDARSREEAKTLVRNKYPNARFFR